MKLAARDVKPFLDQPGKKLGALIYGADRGQVRQRSEQVALAIVPMAGDAFNQVDLTVEALLEDPPRLADELSAMSFTGDRRLITLRDATDKVAPIIEESLSYLHAGNYLLVYAEELAAKSPLRTLFESSPDLVALPCYKDEGQGLDQLIRDTLRGYGVRPDQEIIAYLANNLGGDRMIIVSELEKLSLYQDDAETWDLETVRLVVGESNERTLDDVCHAVASGQIESLCRTLDRLFLEGMQPVVLLRSLHRYFSRLQEAHAAMGRGMGAEQAIKSLRPPVFFKQESVMRRHIERWRPKRLTQALHVMMEAERDCKLGGEQAELLCAHHLLRIARAAG